MFENSCLTVHCVCEDLKKERVGVRGLEERERERGRREVVYMVLLQFYTVT